MSEKKYRGLIVEGHNDLMAAIERLPDAAFYAPPLYEDSGWTVADVLAHIATWQEAMLDALDCLVAGREPFILSKAIKIGVDAFNAHKVAANKGRPLGSIMIELGQRYREVLRMVALFSLEDLETPGRWPWLGENQTLVGLIAENDWVHKREHAEQIRAWRRQNDLGEAEVVQSEATDLLGEFSLALVRYEGEHRRFINMVVALPEKHRQGLLLNGEWSCLEIVFFLTALTEEALAGFAAGKPTDLERDREAFRKQVAAARAGMSWADALIAFQDAHARLVTVADALTAQDVESDPRYLAWIDGLSADLALHAGQLEAAAGAGS